jgi:hypothetical protein
MACFHGGGWLISPWNRIIRMKSSIRPACRHTNEINGRRLFQKNSIRANKYVCGIQKKPAWALSRACLSAPMASPHAQRHVKVSLSNNQKNVNPDNALREHAARGGIALNPPAASRGGCAAGSGSAAQHRKDEYPFSVGSQTPPQAARNAIAVAVHMLFLISYNILYCYKD